MLATHEPVALGGRMDPADRDFFDLKRRLDRSLADLEAVAAAGGDFIEAGRETTRLEHAFTAAPARTLDAVCVKARAMVAFLEDNSLPGSLELMYARGLLADLEALS